MRSFLSYVGRRLGVFSRARSGLAVVIIVVAAVVGGAVSLVVGTSSTAGAREYSAFADPEKPVISYLLSGERNVEEFKRTFDLSDEEVDEALAIVQEERRVLSREYDESEQLIDSNKGASKKRIRAKIAESDFDERVKSAIAATKSDMEDLLPEERKDDLESWVDERWKEERADYQAQSESTYQISSTGHSCGVWATYYRGYTRREVALPHKKLKLDGGYRVRITVVGKGTRTRARVKEVGPWNVRDNYWAPRRYRSMWSNLPRCVPEAEAAYYDNYHRGKDQFGRKVLNPAGLDMTRGVARSLKVAKKIRREGKIKVRVYFPWINR